MRPHAKTQFPMSKKRKFYTEYKRFVNGTEYPTTYTITGVKSKEAAVAKLNRMCKEAGGPEPVITLMREV